MFVGSAMSTNRIVSRFLASTDTEWVSFGEVAREQLGMQAQYAARLLAVPEIAESVRWRGDPARYHNITIHKDDVGKFVERATAWRRARGIIQ